MTRLLRFALPLCLIIVACSDPKVPDEVDAGAPTFDAGVAADAGSPDAGLDGGQSEDAGTTVAAPAGLSYGELTPTYTLGKALSPNSPSYTGGTATSFSVAPTLPEGLLLDTETGIISGTPTKLTPATGYTVTASNEGGSTTVDLQIAVVDVPPAELSYAVAAPTYTLNQAITSNTPSITGGAVVSYAVEPALPTGLALDAETGIISGTPTALSPAATYTVTASNSGGATTATLVLAVVDLPPTKLAYRPPQLTFRKDQYSLGNKPSVGGGAVVFYSISPALPTGLAIDSTTGQIFGTAIALMSLTPYTVTATNSGGSTSVDLQIQVYDQVLVSLSYSNTDIVATKGQAITDVVPSHTGGPITSYLVVNGPLPDGLMLDPVTGVISGTPTTISPRTRYTISGSNFGSAIPKEVSITVNDVQPTALTYSTDTATYTVGTPITANTPIASGGPITSYSVSPNLPDGLSLDSSTGVITGTPTTVVAEEHYLVTATNSGGSTDVELIITVNDAPPSNLTYTYTTAVFTAGTQIPDNVPSSTGGAITEYSISPWPPNYLSFDTTTGILSGTPGDLSPETTYTVTATNSGGSTSTTFVFSVVDAVP